MSSEERVTSSTGGQKGKKPEAFGGGDPLAYIELAKVYAMGEAKYDRYNYLKGYAWSLSIDALFRHLFAFMAGEERDPESGLLHTSHVAWHAQTLTSFQLRGLRQFDDRAPGEATGLPRITEDPERCACHSPGIAIGEQHIQYVADHRGETAVCPCPEEGWLTTCPIHFPLGQVAWHAKAEVDYRGEWAPDTRIAGQLVCCGGTEYHLPTCLTHYSPR